MVHDWLTGMRGGEKVLEALLELFPRAEIFTLFHFPGSVSRAIEARRIHCSPLQRLARGVGDYRTLLPLYPVAAGFWSFHGFDLIVSSSHCVAKSAHHRGIRHICYCHTPMRYMWDRFDDYFPQSRPGRRLAASALAMYLRNWDRSTASRVDTFVANSRFVAERIRTHYRREATVVPPFVGDEFLEAPLAAHHDGPDVIVSALVPYKRIDLAVESARITGRPMKILGSGPLLESLRAQAPPNVEVLGAVSSAMIREILSTARSLVIPGVEDFGIAALEAMASGTPVVAFGVGGVSESVIDGETGLLFREPSPESLAAALNRLAETEWKPERLRDRASAFGRERFLSQIEKVVRDSAFPSQ